MAANRRYGSPALCLAAALILLWSAGCGRESTGPVCHPVQGTVFYQGKPLAEGMVYLHPLDSMETAQRPMAVTDRDGRFELTTFQEGDGAPAGRYTITVELRELQDNGDDEMERAGRNLLPKKFQNPSTSGLEFTVGDGDNVVPQINLK
ncbi:MAG: carboxypeptidase regulatory-like domain-containing protein [Rhodopirellula sp.]|nr:carboxypeptidase regulatory-like domain-containing protein [Rhodopirellula sp.]